MGGGRVLMNETLMSVRRIPAAAHILGRWAGTA
jgi:hypothetical protein